jgi:hypothetical protein
MKWKSLILKTYTIHRMQKVIVKNSPFLGDEKALITITKLIVVTFIRLLTTLVTHIMVKDPGGNHRSGNIIRARSDSGKKEVIEDAQNCGWS